MLKLAEFLDEISALPPQTINEVQKEILIMTSRSAVAKCLLYSIVLFLALAAPSAYAQAGVPQGYMQYPSGNLVVGSTITFTCTVSDVGNAPPSEFANGITVSGPDGYVSHGGTAVAEGGQDIVTYKTTLPYGGTYQTWCLGGLAEENTVTFTVSAAPVGVQGLLYPKYVVVGVTYAPPGNGSGAVSTVQYTGTTAVGSTTTKGSSFSNDVGFSVSFQNGVGTPGGATLAGGNVSLTATESTDYTQTSNNSTSITVSKSTSTAYTTNGYPTTFPITSGAAPNINPASIAAGSTINPHDWDVIQVWLNAEQFFTAFPATSTTPVTFQLNGYAYDPTDLAGPDVYPIQVGCLNGDFTVAYCSTQQGVLNRAWVTSEMSPSTGAAGTAAGCPETAQSPSICPKTQDAYNILHSDLLAYNPGDSVYTLLNGTPLPSTTSDGRFTQFAYPPNPVDYEPGQTEGYTLTQMNTQTESNGGSSQVNEKISVSEKISAGFLGLVKSSITFTESDTMNWTNTWLNSLTTTQTVQDAFTIKGSNPPNYVPGEFIVYQDNQLGTFMFYPSN
jgi:hypothetical protein